MMKKHSNPMNLRIEIYGSTPYTIVDMLTMRLDLHPEGSRIVIIYEYHNSV